jgi:TonB family protein
MLGPVLLASGAVRPAAAADLASARSLYASASYEEALSVLSELEASESAEQIERLRALCLLALGRVPEAEQSLERIVLQKPLYVISEAEVSPRLVTLFREVRRRALPAAADAAYARARASFDREEFATASAQFKELLAIAADPEAVSLGGPSLGELARLAEGFLKLSDAALEAAAPAPAPPTTVSTAASPPAAPTSAAPPAAPTSAAPPAAPTSAALPAAPTVYTARDAGVTAPVAIERRFPSWVPPSGAVARSVFRGALELVVDERGRVASASMAEPVSPLYDRRLLEAAKDWRFQPAKRDGVPVRFQMTIGVALQPSLP